MWLNGLKRQDPTICLLQETHFSFKDTHRLKAKGWKKIFDASRNQKGAEVAILISDKIDFKPKTVRRNKEGHYTRIKVSVHQENITIISTYAPNIEATKYIKQILTDLKGEIDNNISRGLKYLIFNNG